jgi:hypothetical protein
MSVMGEYPESDRITADEERIDALLRAVEAPAPAALKSEIVARNASRAPRIRRVPAFALTFATACAAAALALVLGSGAAAPTVMSAARVAFAGPTAATPATLVAAGTSITFPDWAARGWPSAGIRHDRMGGRSLTTEFYHSYDAGTFGYVITSGPPLKWGASGTSRIVGGERYQLISSGGGEVVTWVQQGHTCIIASRSASPRTMLALAIAQERSTTA